MTSPRFTRRQFVQTSAVAATALAVTRSATAAPSGAGGPHAAGSSASVPLRWLDGTPPTAQLGGSWGVPWAQGAVPAGTSVAMSTATGEQVPLQSWPLATWPDGSLKWTAHAVPGGVPAAEAFYLRTGESPAVPDSPLRVTETAEAIVIESTDLRVELGRQGSSLIRSVIRGGVETLREGRLICLRQDAADADGNATVTQESFEGVIDRITPEQSGPVRAVVKIEGRHASRSGERRWLPFVLRLYVYAGSDALRMVHTFVFDGDEQVDFIRGLGLRFTAPLRDALHDRHVRFSGEGDGLFAEAVRGLTGLRRDPGKAVREAQLAGAATPPVESWDPRASGRINYIPAFGDWTLAQVSADAFTVRKRTQSGHGWLQSAAGRRSSGLGYVGGPSGGVAFGLRNFWQSHPAQLDIRNAVTDAAEVTVWWWAPDAPPMDLRFYHDGMGADTHPEQLEAMEITYEDYEPGFGTPHGVARTSELYLFALPGTPARERLVELAKAVEAPPMVTVTPEYLLGTRVFGGLWSLPDRSTPQRAKIEDELDFYFNYYVQQRDLHRWYGFWNYGDVMHTYDQDRHVWRYDVGGFAWDNSELSTDIWLWLHYLRTGRADAFRFAEAMTRHTGEVDVHHLGRFAPLGSRHNVLHWGCSAKQLRISTAQNRRYYYYLTGDERVGDLLREQIDAHFTLSDIQPGRKLGARGGPSGAAGASAEPGYAAVGFGTDWGSVAAAWLTEWERTGSDAMRNRLVNSMRTIAAQPRRFFSSQSRMHLDSGAFDIRGDDRVSVSHLSSVFGLVEVCAELLQVLPEPTFRAAWLEYCELYNAAPDEQARRLGRRLEGLNLQQGHSRLTAFASRELQRPELADRAWKEFRGGSGGMASRDNLALTPVSGPTVIEPLEVAPWVSTNAVAQWGLAAIQCLALVGDALEPTR